MDIKDLPQVTSLVDDIQDFINNPNFSPKEQNKWFFSDGLSYYQQLCEIMKLLEYFQQAFKIVQENENTLASAFDVTEEEVETLATKVDELSSAVESELARLDTLEQDNVTIKSDISTIKDDVAANREDISSLQSDNTSNKARISSLENDNTTNKNDIASLKTDNNTNKEKISSLETDNTTNKAKISSLETDNETNKTNISLLQDDNDLNKGKIELLEKDNTTNKSDIASLKTDNTTNKSDIASLKTDNTTNKANIETNTNDIKALNDKDFLQLVKILDSANITVTDSGKKDGIQTFQLTVTGSTPANLSSNLTFFNNNPQQPIISTLSLDLDSTNNKITLTGIKYANGEFDNVDTSIQLSTDEFKIVDSTLSLAKEYLESSTAESTYLKKTDASNTYETKTNASNTYETKTNASNTYETKTNASNTYETKTNASNTYATKTALSSEQSARESADKTLQGNIDSEKTNRENADKTLQGNIETLTSNLNKLTNGQSIADGTSIDTIVDNGFYHQVGDWSGTLPSVDGIEWHYSNLLAFNAGVDVTVQMLFPFNSSECFAFRTGRNTPLTWQDWSVVNPNSKQDKLISGTNIKTINNNSILGNGNIAIENKLNFIKDTPLLIGTLDDKELYCVYIEEWFKDTGTVTFDTYTKWGFKDDDVVNYDLTYKGFIGGLLSDIASVIPLPWYAATTEYVLIGVTDERTLKIIMKGVELSVYIKGFIYFTKDVSA